MTHIRFTTCARAAVLAVLLAGAAWQANADVVTDWNVKAGEFIVEAKIGTPPANRVMAIVQTAVLDAVTAVTGQPAAAIDAAVAAANRAALSKLFPAQEAAIGNAYRAALAAITDGPAKQAGIAAGEAAAAAVLAARADDGAARPETYRPHTTAGAYVPTAPVAASQWPQRKPWLMTTAAQFRPGPPPLLSSAQWARDYQEVKVLGGKASTRRSAEQTEIARFWEYSLPPIYHGVLRSVALAPGRDAAGNARLFAVASQAMDDALIAVMDAKYHYNFWRPATAIRNGDIDGNDATEVDASWVPFIETPMHPEYPSAHSILAGTLEVVLRAEVGNRSFEFSTTSPSAKGAVRSWKKIDDLTQEVANARIYDGLHYRTSTEVGTAMGRQIGELAVKKFVPH